MTITAYGTRRSARRRSDLRGRVGRLPPASRSAGGCLAACATSVQLHNYKASAAPGVWNKQVSEGDSTRFVGARPRQRLAHRLLNSVSVNDDSRPTGGQGQRGSWRRDQAASARGVSSGHDSTKACASLVLIGRNRVIRGADSGAGPEGGKPFS